MKKPFLFIDTEFDGDTLLSMGLVAVFDADLENTWEFYEVIIVRDEVIVDPWVKENVVPVFNKEPIFYPEFQEKLFTFLHRFKDNSFVLIADWPEDISHFCKALITEPGQMVNIPSFEMKVELIKSLDTARLSKVPHNALEDAKALKRELMQRHKYSLY